MDYIFTDGTNRDFIILCAGLDEHLNAADGILTAVAAYENNRAVACAAIKKYDDSKAEIKRVFTLPGYRGRGICCTLVSALEKKRCKQVLRRLFCKRV